MKIKTIKAFNFQHNKGNMSMKNDEVQTRLMKWFDEKDHEKKDIIVSNIESISEGWESEIYSFHILYNGNLHDDLILRVYPGDFASEKASKEFHGMKKLHSIGFPVPKVFALEHDVSFFGRPFVLMEKINGKLIQQVFNESSSEKQKELLTLFCSTFVWLHKINWKNFVEDPSLYKTDDPYSFISNELTRAYETAKYFDLLSIAQPVLEWLDDRKLSVPCEKLSIVHGDYHPNNIILTNDNTAYVIDWTNINIADYRTDLAWTLLLTSSYGNPEAYTMVLNEYESISGKKVKGIDYFIVFAIARRLFSIIVSIKLGPSKLGMRPGAEKMIKSNIKTYKNCL